MPVQLDKPVAIEEFAHADFTVVEYVLHPLTTRVRVYLEGDAGRVRLADLNPDPSMSAHYWPIADGELQAFPFTSIPNAGRAVQRGTEARVEGRSLFVGLDNGPGTVRIVSDRGV